MLAGTGIISGTVFHDLDASGTFDTNESGLPNVGVYLDANQNGQFDSPREIYTETPEPPLPIPDETTTTSDLVIIRPQVIGAEGGLIVDLDVEITLEHTYVGDIEISLVHQSGPRIKLYNHHGGGGDNLTHTVFDDEASLTFDTSEAPFTNRFRPTESLDAFDGLSVDGPWTLVIADTVGGDFGQLLEWSLSATTTKTPSSEPITFTDADGHYQFGDLEPGDFHVGAIPSRGFIQSSPAPNAFLDVVVNDVGPTANANFGLTIAPGSISGTVFIDGNGDRVRGIGEVGQDSVVVELLDQTTREVLATTTTYTNQFMHGDAVVSEPGYYRFDNIAPGQYLVREVVPDGYEPTAPSSQQRPLAGETPVIQAGTFEVTQPPIGTVDNPAPWLPDLIIDPVNGLRDVFLDGDHIRFSQATPNVGHGPLRIVGGEDNGDGTQDVLQRIYDDQGGFTERLAGLFEFHPEHNHIHFNEFSEYRLLAALPDADNDGIPEVGQMLRGGEKTSFCLIDISQYQTNPPLPNAAPQSSGLGCDVEQQISVGWEDIYGAGTPGQEVRVDGLPNGQYWLEAVVDPANHFIEVDETNNFARILITLTDETNEIPVTVTPGEETHLPAFGNFRRFNLSGDVFADNNANGARDENEPTIAHRGVFLDLNGDGVLNNHSSGDGIFDGLAEEPWRLTDEDGHYSFTDLGRMNFYSLVLSLGDQEFAANGNAQFFSPNGQDFEFNFGVSDATTTPTVLIDYRADFNSLAVADVSGVGLDNLISVSADNGLLYIHDELRFLRLSPDMDVTGAAALVDEHTVSINTAMLGNGISIQVSLNGGNDSLVFESLTSDILGTAVSGGDGNDTVVGSELTDLIVGEFGNDELNGGGGDDIISGFDGDDLILGGSGNDILSGGSGENTIAGGDGTDQLHEENQLIVLLSDERFEFSTPFIIPIDPIPIILDDSINATELIPPPVFDEGLSHLVSIESAYVTADPFGFGLSLDATGFSGDLIALGSSGADSILGGSGNDILRSFEGNDIINGGSGDDVIYLSLGEDNLVGGDGNDLFIYEEDVSLVGSPIVTLDGGDGQDILTIDFARASQFVVEGRSGQSSQGLTFTFTDVESLSVFGSGEADNFRVSDLSFLTVYLEGGDGDDFLFASGTLVGSAGNDILMGLNGNDSLVGEDGDDLITGGLGDDVLSGGTGFDTVKEVAGGSYTVSSNRAIGIGTGTDLISGFEGVHITGSANADRIDASAFPGIATLIGGAGNDSLFGTRSNDSLVGGPGNDSIIGDRGNDVLIGGDGSDALNGGSGNDLLHGEAGNDALTGGSGNDVLIGNRGRDAMIPGPGDDVVDGGDGEDSARFSANAFFVLTNDGASGEGNDVFLNNGRSMPFRAVEIATITGGTAGDVINAELYSGKLIINAGSGDDTLFGGLGSDVLNGQDGDDIINSGIGGDRVNGGAGQDLVHSEGSSNYILTDTSLTGIDSDALEGIERGALQASDTASYIDASGFSGITFLAGGPANDTLIGGAGNDIIHGNGGNDILKGRGGDDVIYGSDGNDTLNGGDGNDTLYGNSGNDALSGYRGNDFITGDDGDDTLIGGLGNDVLQGNAGADLLRGDFGADSIAGNGGTDSVIILGATIDDVVNRQNTERLLSFRFIADWIDSI